MGYGWGDGEAVDGDAFVGGREVALALVAVVAGGALVAARAAVVGVVFEADAAVAALILRTGTRPPVTDRLRGAGSTTGAAVINVVGEEVVARVGTSLSAAEGLRIGAVAFAALIVVDEEVLARDVGADGPVVEVGGFEALQVDQVGVPVVEIVAARASHAVVELVVAAFKGAGVAVVVAIV